MSIPRISAYESSQSFQYLGLQNTPSKGPEPVYSSFLRPFSRAACAISRDYIISLKSICGADNERKMRTQKGRLAWFLYTHAHSPLQWGDCGEPGLRLNTMTPSDREL